MTPGGTIDRSILNRDPSSGDNAPGMSRQAVESTLSALDSLPVPVRAGSTDQNTVRVIQTALYFTGFYTGPIDGIFEENTRGALMNLQSSAGLIAGQANAIGGGFGPKTKEEIKKILIRKARELEVKEGTGKNNGIVEKISQMGGLKRGSSGKNVQTLQEALAVLGYFNGKQKGNFGPITEAAVIKFQLDKGLIASGESRVAGIVGPNMRNALKKALGVKEERVTLEPESIQDINARTRTEVYINNNYPEYRELLNGERTIASIGPLETFVNTRNYINGFMDDVKPISRVERAQLAAARCEHQTQYLQRITDKYEVTKARGDALAALYRMNGATKSYSEELEDLNNQIHNPLKPECRMTIVLPAYKEEKNIKNTLKDWISQQGKDGKPLDPESFEIIILINKPNAAAQFDGTKAEIEKFKREHPKYSIFAVEKTFNFLPPKKKGSDETGTADVRVRGKDIKVAKGTGMGMIYKMCGDLAILRNSKRMNGASEKVKEVSADHLVRTGGADAYSRNPRFLGNILRTFERYPTLDQLKSEADFPPDVFEKIPLIHILERFRQSMNRLYTEGSAAYGLGTYRAGLYAEVGGFNLGLNIAEELNLSNRMKAVTAAGRKPNVYKTTTINALEDPRRRVLRVLNGRNTVTEYDDFDNNELVRAFQVANIPTTLPAEAVLTERNAGYHFTTWLNHFIRKAHETGAKFRGNFKGAFETMKKYATVSLLGMGFQIDDFEIVPGNGIDDPEGPGKIIIKNLSHIKVELEKYKNTAKPNWMRKMRNRNS